MAESKAVANEKELLIKPQIKNTRPPSTPITKPENMA